MCYIYIYIYLINRTAGVRDRRIFRRREIVGTFRDPLFGLALQIPGSRFRTITIKMFETSRDHLLVPSFMGS